MPVLISSLTLICAASVRAQNPATTVTVNATTNNHAISPYIYGVNWPAAADYANLNLPIARAGGENIDEYNWQSGQNASNTASDWYFESNQGTGGSAANGTYDAFVNAGKSTSTQSILTVPMLPYIAHVGTNGARTWSYSIAKYGAQTGSDPYQSDAGNGVSSATGKNITTNNPLDAYVANSGSTQSGMVGNLVSTYGTAQNGGVKFYAMDNEPSLWDNIHRDIHNGPVNYQELYNDYTTYALAVRNADPTAQILGDEEWGWSNYWYDDNGQSDYTANGNMYFIPWLLQQLKNYQTNNGKQLINILSVHFYPQDGSDSNTDNSTQDTIRDQSTRALWDPNYVDQSWIGQTGFNGGKPELIPLLQGWVNTYYPGLGTAITEYNWGDDANLNGATTQADILGIFGRQNLTIGTRWGIPPNPSPTYLAFEIYRNYDGSKSTFGDTSCSDTVANPDNLSSFAATRSTDGALTVMVINKQTGTTPVTINLQNFSAGSSASVYQISSASQSSINKLANATVSNNAISFTAPSQSITLFVIPQSTGTPAFTMTASASPNPVAAGSPTTISSSTKDTGGPLSNANVQVLIVNSGGTTVDTQNFTGVNFNSGQTVPEQFNWTPTATGTYTLEGGVFNQSWGTNYYWNSNFGSITVTSSDPAEYNFESGTQSWGTSGAPISSVAQSSTQVFAGSHSLAVNISGAAGAAEAEVASPGTAAGKTITFHVWVPSGSQITSIQPYEMDHNWTWTGNYQTIGNLHTNAWNTLTVTVPSNAAMPLQQLGVQFTTGATWTGTCYVDSISW